MSSHFFVIKLKDIIKIIIIMAIIALILVMLLRTPHPAFKASQGLYSPGTYMTALSLDKDIAHIAVTVDENNIRAVELTEAGPSTEYFYPLLKSTAALIGDEIVKTQSLSVKTPENAPVTAHIILNAVEDALTEAKSK